MLRLRNCKPIHFLIAAALLANLLLSALATGNSPGHFQLASLFGDKITICTAQGAVEVPTKDLAKKPFLPDGFSCQLCYVLASGINTTPANAVILPAPDSTHFLHHTTFGKTAPIIRDIAWASLHTRAPPATFIV